MTSIWACSGKSSNVVGEAADPDLIATLKPGHPRLLMDSADWMALADKALTDPVLAKVVARIEDDAKWLLSQPPLVYKMEGKRLLDVSRQALQRILLWGVAYHLTGEAAYAAHAKQELLNLAGFKDWNPSHFLDTAEMTAAMAIGYDWFYDQLSVSDREAIRKAIMEKGLIPGLRSTEAVRGWPRSENNWNQVCFGGLTLGALAIADEEPELAVRFLKEAKKGIVFGLRPYAPDGVYPEGPGYWGYGTVYQTLMLSALQSALGTKWGLDQSPGFMASTAAQEQLTGPTGQFYNYFDCEEQVGLQPAMFWFAHTMNDPRLLRSQQVPLKEALQQSVKDEKPYHENRLFSLVALWWTGLPKDRMDADLPLAWKGDGENPVGIFRSSWSDPNALYLAFKGGRAGLSHGHMDAGSFILEADGVRWAVDLGRQDYLSLESKGINLWSYAQNSQRWSVYRLNNFSHNTLTISNRLHRVDGQARIIDFDNGANPHATLDLTPVFGGQADLVERTFSLQNDRCVVISDHIVGLTPGTPVRWAMTTRADVTVNDIRAVLKQDGKILLARLESSPPASFEVITASPPDDGFNAPNPDTRLLVATIEAPASGKVRIAVELETMHNTL